MPKKFKKTQKPCQSHLFSLKPEPKQVLSARSLNLTLSFCSQNTEDGSSKPKQANCLQAPVYNDDGSFASPAFTLACDKNFYAQRREKMLDEHELRFAHFTDEKSELNIPRPKSKNCYCSVCRQYYEDYLDHVQSSSHKSRIAANPFTKHIDELTRTFEQHRPLNNTHIQFKTSLNKSIIIEDIQKDSDEVEIISNPVKKIKTDEVVVAKEVKTPPKVEQQVEQPFYPFSGCHNYLNYGTQSKQLNSLPYHFNFNFNFAFNPYSLAQSLPNHLASAYLPPGMPPFLLPGQGFHTLGVGTLPGV